MGNGGFERDRNSLEVPLNRRVAWRHRVQGYGAVSGGRTVRIPLSELIGACSPPSGTLQLRLEGCITTSAAPVAAGQQPLGWPVRVRNTRFIRGLAKMRLRCTLAL